MTPAQRTKADATIAAMRRQWAENDRITDAANRAFDQAFRKALKDTKP
jgi:hypothetical protein